MLLRPHCNSVMLGVSIHWNELLDWITRLDYSTPLFYFLFGQVSVLIVKRILHFKNKNYSTWLLGEVLLLGTAQHHNIPWQNAKNLMVATC